MCYELYIRVYNSIVIVVIDIFFLKEYQYKKI